VVVVAARGFVKNLNGEHVVAIVREDLKVTVSDHALALAVGGYLFLLSVA
jgi:hypothetical protein